MVCQELVPAYTTSHSLTPQPADSGVGVKANTNSAPFLSVCTREGQGFNCTGVE